MHQAFRAAIVLVLAAPLLPGAARAADKLFAYNETTSTTFTGVYLAPAGTGQWGSNQALNDKDKTLEPSERLLLKEAGHGTYDVRLVDTKGQTCLKSGVDLSHDSSFEIQDGDLKACR